MLRLREMFEFSSNEPVLVGITHIEMGTDRFRNEF